MNYGLPMCGVNKLMGKMELVLLRDEWISLFSHGTFQRYSFRAFYSIRSNFRK